MLTKSLLFTTGQFARLHHLNKRTLHYYDEIGLFSPAFKGENDYRYYTWQQSADLENILALRELHMSIDEIRAYLHSPNPQGFLALSDRKIGEIDETIRHLTKLRAVMKEKQDMLHLSMQIKDGQIDTVQCEEEALYITPLPQTEPLPENGPSQMDTLLSHLQTAWDLTDYKTGCGSLLSLEKIGQNRFDEYDGLFTRLEKPAPINGIYRKPAGLYLRGFCVGDWDKLPALYGQMLAFAREKGWELQGYSYEIGLNEFAIADSKEYVTQVTILVS